MDITLQSPVLSEYLPILKNPFPKRRSFRQRNVFLFEGTVYFHKEFTMYD